MNKLLPLILLGAVLVFWGLSREQAGIEPDLRSATSTVPDVAPGGELEAALPAAVVREERARVSNASSDAISRTPAAASVVTIGATIVNPEGAPIEGVELVCVSIPGKPSAYSDAAGEIKLVILSSDLYDLREKRVSFLIQSASTVCSSKRPVLAYDEDTHLGRFILKPGGSFTGRVLTAGGQPVEGATVFCVKPVIDHGPEYMTWLRLRGLNPSSVQVETDAEGQYIVPGVEPGRYSVQASTLGTLKSLSAPVTARVGAPTAVPDLILEAAGREYRIEGVVLDIEGRPQSGVPVDLSTPGGNQTLLLKITDDQGAFAFIAVPGALYEVSAGHKRADMLFAYDVSPGTLDLVLQPRDLGSIKVLARTQSGEPIPGFNARMYLENGRPAPGFGGNSPRGEALSLRLPIERFSIVAYADQYARVSSKTYDRANAPESVELVLLPSPGVCGRVVMSGIGVAGASIEANFVRNPGRTLVSRKRNGLHDRFDVTYEWKATSDGQGNFVLGTDLDRFRKSFGVQLHLHAKAPGYTYGPRVVLDLVEGTAHGNVVLELGLPGSMKGRVLSGGDVDSRGMQLAISRGDSLVLRKTLETAGSYEFEGLAPGLWQAVLEPAGKPASWGDGTVGYTEAAEIEWDFEVQPGKATLFDLHAEIEPILDMSLRCQLLVNGLPPADWGWGAFDYGEQLGRGALDANGQFLVEVSGSGSFMLTLTPPAIAPYFVAGFSTRVDIEEGDQAWSYDLATSSLFLTGLAEPLVSQEDQMRRMFKNGMWSFKWEDPNGAMKWWGGPSSLPTEGLLVPNVPVGLLHAEKTVGYEIDEESKFIVGVHSGKTTNLDLGQ